MKTLIRLPIYLAIFFMIFCCLLSSAHAWEYPKIGLEAKVQDAQQYTFVKQHTHTTERQYVYNDPQSIADREFQESVLKLDAKQERKAYHGR